MSVCTPVSAMCRCYVQVLCAGAMCRCYACMYVGVDHLLTSVEGKTAHTLNSYTLFSNKHTFSSLETEAADAGVFCRDSSMYLCQEQVRASHTNTIWTYASTVAFILNHLQVFINPLNINH